MKPSDFFIEEEGPDWDLKRTDTSRRMQTVIHVAFIDGLRQWLQESVGDIEAAYDDGPRAGARRARRRFATAPGR